MFLFIGLSFTAGFNVVQAEEIQNTAALEQQISELKETLANLQQQAAQQKNTSPAVAVQIDVPAEDIEALTNGLNDLMKITIAMQSQLIDNLPMANKEAIIVNLNNIKNNLIAINQIIVSPIEKKQSKALATTQTKKNESIAKSVAEQNSKINENNESEQVSAANEQPAQTELQASAISTMMSKLKNRKVLTYAAIILALILVVGSALKFRKNLTAVALAAKNKIIAIILLLKTKFKKKEIVGIIEEKPASAIQLPPDAS